MAPTVLSMDVRSPGVGTRRALSLKPRYPRLHLAPRCRYETIAHMPEFGRFPSVTRAAKTHMTARQGELEFEPPSKT